MSVEKGQQAPDFTLYNEQREAVQLADYRGQNVLLLFFPGAFTSVCTNELDAVSNEIGDFGEHTAILGVSTDSPFVQNEFKKLHGFAFPLLSDHEAEVSAAYGAKYDHDFTDMGLDRIAKRAAFVIDKEGTVQYAEVLDNAGELPNFDEVKRVLGSL